MEAIVRTARSSATFRELTIHGVSANAPNSVTASVCLGVDRAARVWMPRPHGTSQSRVTVSDGSNPTGARS
jgi:hypothetical protein